MTKDVYMLGVCGMGMAPLAAFLKDDGYNVSGFDDTPNKIIKESLENHGIVFEPPKNFNNKREVIISTALAPRLHEIRCDTNCDFIYLRGEFWAKTCAKRNLTAIVGSHGKSSVSALMAHAITKLGIDCGYLVGAIPNNFPMHKHCAEKKNIISEIDESDGTIEGFTPAITVALNADLDHTYTYVDDTSLEEMFRRLFERTKNLVLYPANDKILSKIAAESSTPSRAIKTSGDFESINKTMALAACEETFKKRMPKNIFDDFKGIMRRQEVIVDTPELRVIGDYAHHPNEVKSFLEWFCEKNPGNKLIAFQPHRYTRTRRFAESFAKILSSHASDTCAIALLPVYAASEAFDELGESSQITKFSNSIMLANSSEFLRMSQDKINDLNGKKLSIAIVGAGDFYFTAKDFFQTLK